MSEGRKTETELLVYPTILVMWLFPDRGNTSPYRELLQCLAFSLSCIISALASISGRRIKTGVLLCSLPSVSISPCGLESWKKLDPFWSILGQKALSNSIVKMMEKQGHHLPFRQEDFSCFCDSLEAVELKHQFLTLLVLASFVTCCMDSARAGK